MNVEATSCVSSPEQLTLEWFRKELGSQSSFEGCQFIDVAVVESEFRDSATFVRQLLRYYNPVGEIVRLPVISKISNPQYSKLAGKKEVAFARELAPLCEGVPLVRTFAATFSPDKNQSHLLLEDLTETHGQTERPVQPTIAQTALALRALARLHARYWQDADLDTLVGESYGPEYFTFLSSALPGMVERFLEGWKSDLSPYHENAFRVAARSAPAVFERRLERAQPRTLIHGSAHAWNFLFPKDASSGDVRIIDWSDWTTGVGTDDAAYLIALFWDRPRRAEFEKQLLEGYFAALLSFGVKDYTWEDCWNDYRLSVIKNLFLPVFFCDGGMVREEYAPYVKAACSAFEDLQCDQLLVPRYELESQWTGSSAASNGSSQLTSPIRA